jgi:membrane protein YqaA with SNARE-associated domain
MKHYSLNIFGYLSKKLYELKSWVESFAEKPYASAALFFFAFIESSFFPIPPDALLIVLAISKPLRSFIYAFYCTLGSVLGAYLGYLIGYVFYDTIGLGIIKFYGVENEISYVLGKYQENGFLAIATAAFTPIPYKVFTILAGFNLTIDLWTLTIASLIGRAGRFFLVAGMIFWVGPKIKIYIEKYFDKLALVFAALLIFGFFLLKYLL